MLRKAITYIDYDGNVQTEEHYFNLKKSELVEMENSTTEGLQAKLQKLLSENDGFGIYSFIKDFILAAYGMKSEDGKRFIKSKELSEDFANSEAFESLLAELTEETGAADAFILGVIPTSIAAEAFPQKGRKPYPVESFDSNTM